MAKKKHKRCATPGCPNIVPKNSKKGTICGICHRALKEKEPKPIEEQPVQESEFAQRLKTLDRLSRRG